jgi:hypothetical protein
VRRIAKTWTALALALASACSSGTETGNPPAAAELTIAALSNQAPTQGLVLEEARIFLEHLSLVPCDTSAAPLTTDDFPIDLFHDPPAHVTFESAVTDYCGVRLDVAPFGGSAPAALAGLSVFVSGVRSDDATFTLASTLAGTLVLVSDTGPLDATKLVLGVTPEHWFADADVHGAEVSPEGVAVIDALHNPDVLAGFEAGTAPAFALYVDADADGLLTGEELTPVATAVAE